MQEGLNCTLFLYFVRSKEKPVCFVHPDLVDCRFGFTASGLDIHSYHTVRGLSETFHDRMVFKEGDT